MSSEGMFFVFFFSDATVKCFPAGRQVSAHQLCSCSLCLTDEAEVTAQPSVKRRALGINIIFVCLQRAASSPIHATDSLTHTHTHKVGLCGLFGKETANKAKISSEGKLGVRERWRILLPLPPGANSFNEKNK